MKKQIKICFFILLCAKAYSAARGNHFCVVLIWLHAFRLSGNGSKVLCST